MELGTSLQWTTCKSLSLGSDVGAHVEILSLQDSRLSHPKRMLALAPAPKLNLKPHATRLHQWSQVLDRPSDRGAASSIRTITDVPETLATTWRLMRKGSPWTRIQKP